MVAREPRRRGEGKEQIPVILVSLPFPSLFPSSPSHSQLRQTVAGTFPSLRLQKFVSSARLGVEPSNPGTARLSDQTTESMSEELIDAAQRGDVGVVRAILDRGNVNINGDRVTIFLFILFYLFNLFIRMELLLFIGQAVMVIPVW
jgi:hypothetical protein